MADLLRISLKGTMPGGEEWSVNPCWSLGDFGAEVTPAQAQAVVDAILLTSPNAAVRTMWTNSVAWTGVRVEARTLAGELETLAEGVRPSTVAGTGSLGHPYQTSWVTSLRTDAVGASGRGRVYWPATAVVTDTDTLRPIAGVVTAALAGINTWLQDIDTAIDTVYVNAGLAVWSRTKQALYPVRRLEMGDILDTQRRRRDALVESYQTLTWVI